MTLGERSWSPNGRYLAFAGAINKPSVDIYVLDTPHHEVRWLTAGPDHPRGLHWSPDNRWIVHTTVREVRVGGASGVANEVWVVHVETGETKLLLEPVDSTCSL